MPALHSQLNPHSEVSKPEHQASALRCAIQAARRAGVGHVTFQMEAGGLGKHRAAEVLILPILRDFAGRVNNEKQLETCWKILGARWFSPAHFFCKAW